MWPFSVFDYIFDLLDDEPADVPGPEELELSDIGTSSIPSNEDLDDDDEFAPLLPAQPTEEPTNLVNTAHFPPLPNEEPPTPLAPGSAPCNRHDQPTFPPPDLAKRDSLHIIHMLEPEEVQLCISDQRGQVPTRTRCPAEDLCPRSVPCRAQARCPARQGVYGPCFSWCTARFATCPSFEHTWHRHGYCMPDYEVDEAVKRTLEREIKLLGVHPTEICGNEECRRKLSLYEPAKKSRFSCFGWDWSNQQPSALCLVFEYTDTCQYGPFQLPFRNSSQIHHQIDLKQFKNLCKTNLQAKLYQLYADFRIDEWHARQQRTWRRLGFDFGIPTPEGGPVPAPWVVPITDEVSRAQQSLQTLAELVARQQPGEALVSSTAFQQIESSQAAPPGVPLDSAAREALLRQLQRLTTMSRGEPEWERLLEWYSRSVGLRVVLEESNFMPAGLNIRRTEWMVEQTDPEGVFWDGDGYRVGPGGVTLV
ncbi:hypothetical protein BJ508DRAFT_334382 [Ascobolus immersus RN42]|uniref:Uncharacterized protein n=1 Tax=Ascobolus immersus RN42 TaxID=1160509 RepID=A0A3N4HJK9_ASCIM|nr:hypothetical protein BJ508DRAFT_334382 [Ascobolus immersus RN42]